VKRVVQQMKILKPMQFVLCFKKQLSRTNVQSMTPVDDANVVKPDHGSELDIAHHVGK
jgi:hypothetical protein